MFQLFQISLLLSVGVRATVLKIPVEWASANDPTSPANSQRPQLSRQQQSPIGVDRRPRRQTLQDDSQLVLELDVGTPAQKVRLVPDLTSNIFVVPTAACHTKARKANRDCESSGTFNSTLSSTYLRGPSIPELPWREATFRGNLARDVISFGSNSTFNKSFTEASVVHSKRKSRSAGSHGVFGLKLGRSFADSDTLFQGMFDAGHLDSKVFGVELPHGQKSGQLTLGGLDHGLTLNDVNMIPAIQSGNLGWAVEAKYLVHISDGFYLTTHLENCTAELDFNFPGFAFPRPFLQEILTALGSPPDAGFTAETITFPCDYRMQMPEIAIGLGQNGYRLDAFDYAFETEDDRSGKSMCAVRIHSASALPAHRGCMIVGREFFSAHYSVFDVESMKVGFIKQSDF
ncbi:aspartic peptidase domain-containing protein [Phyllosticta capitalensis]